MLMQTRLVWIGLIITISLGLAIEALKSTRNSHDGSSWHPRIFGMQDFDNEDQEPTIQRTEKAGRARSRLLKGRIADLNENSPLANLGKTTSLETTAAVALPGPPIPNLTPLKLTQSDEAKKKAEAAKKKKKKKKKAAEEAIAQQPYQAPSEPSKKADPSLAITGNSNMTRGGNLQRNLIVGGNTSTDKPETLEQWLTFILREPSYERTVRLIQAQQARTIDPEIFYEVTTQMLADYRAKMHEYAIYALGSTASLKSFLLLEAANLREAEGSLAKSQSRSYLKTYSRLENLRYLAGVIAGTSESSSALEALRLIQIAVMDYKPTSSAPSRPTTSRLNASKQFSTLLPALARIAKTADDAMLRQEADTTLRQVQILVGSSATPAV